MVSTPNAAPNRARNLALAIAVGVPLALCAPAVGQLECRTARARSDIDAVGAAMFAWLTDIVSAADSMQSATAGLAPLCPGSPPVDLTLVPPIHAAILSIFLVPDYIDAVPLDDPWGQRYEYRLNVADPLSADVIAVRSAGADGLFEGTSYDVRFTAGPAEDLVFYNDAWIRDVPRLDPVSRQRVTTEQVRKVGAALLAWYTDIVSCVSGAGRSAPVDRGAGDVDMGDYPPMSAEDLAELLSVPLLYARCVPELDGWGTPYDYRVNEIVCGTGGPGVLGAIRSLGSDALAEGDVYTAGTFPADERQRDIVWADGQFIREPDASGVEIFLDGYEAGQTWGYWSCAPGY